MAVQAERKGAKIYKTYLGLLDTGSSSSLMDVAIAKETGSKDIKGSETKWNTQAGQFKTLGSKNFAALRLPQFSIHRTFSSTFHLFEKKPEGRYDVILGRDVLQLIGLDIINSSKQFEWNGIMVDMVPRGRMVKDVESQLWRIQDDSSATGTAFRAEDKLEKPVILYSIDDTEAYMQGRILDANYEKIPLEVTT